jgi:hypothetical protein
MRKANMSTHYVKKFKDQYGCRTIAYLPVFAQLVGINAAIMLSQLIFWSNNARAIEREGWFYKSVRELQEETGLSKRQQQSARQILLDTGLIEAKLVGIPRTWHYKVNLEALDALFQGSESAGEANLAQSPEASTKGGQSVQNRPNIGSSSRPTLGANGAQLKKVPRNSQEITPSKHRSTHQSTDPRNRNRTKKAPEIELFRKITGRYPRKDQFELVIKAAAGKTYDDLKPYWDEWVARDYRRTNLAWLLDWAEQGYVPVTIGNGGRGSRKKPSIQALPTESEDVLAEYHRLNPNHGEGE